MNVKPTSGQAQGIGPCPREQTIRKEKRKRKKPAQFLFITVLLNSYLDFAHFSFFGGRGQEKMGTFILISSFMCHSYQDDELFHTK